MRAYTLVVTGVSGTGVPVASGPGMGWGDLGLREQYAYTYAPGGWILKGTHRSCGIDDARGRIWEPGERGIIKKKKDKKNKKDSEGGRNKQNDGGAAVVRGGGRAEDCGTFIMYATVDLNRERGSGRRGKGTHTLV